MYRLRLRLQLVTVKIIFFERDNTKFSFFYRLSKTLFLTQRLSQETEPKLYYRSFSNQKFRLHAAPASQHSCALSLAVRISSRGDEGDEERQEEHSVQGLQESQKEVVQLTPVRKGKKS
jgi:hypothetical protein